MYLRPTFYESLPDSSTIRKWYKNINGGRGFNNDGLKALKRKVDEMGNLLVAITFDEM